MKILIFTYKSDIDGMGGAILAKLAFDEVDYVLCETFNLQNEVSKFYDNGRIYKYDKVFITDLWLEEPMLSRVKNDKKLKDKFFVFDHHKSAQKDNPNYSFTTLKISDENGLCSGTSLFYEYLVSTNQINQSLTGCIKEFVELTRRYDTWEWKTKYDDEMAHELSLLFDSIGCDGYIRLMFEKLSGICFSKFQFSELEKMLINNKINEVQEKLLNYANKVYYRNIFGLKAGIVFIDYEYRNDLAEYFKMNGYDMNFAMLISLDNGTISYRTIKDGVDVGLISEKFGGKGHEKSSSSPINQSRKEEIIKLLTMEVSK